MRLQLDPESPLPLYHQIVEALRYRIATGDLTPDELLPTIREAATLWGVNMHTVRRAYGDLAHAGLVESRPSRGTRVVGPLPRTGEGALGEFLARVAREGREEHGLSPAELAGMLEALDRPERSRPGAVHVLECNPIQCEQHARELSDYWDVDAQPWCLDQAGDPPRGALVATYFHYNEVRRRWPERLSEIYFATIRPAPALLREVRTRGGERVRRLLLCELEEAIGLNIVADLSNLFAPDQFSIEAVITKRPAKSLEGRGRTPVLFSPRTWSRLTDKERDHPRAFEVRYVFTREELESVGRHFRWRRRAAQTATPRS